MILILRLGDNTLKYCSWIWRKNGPVYRALQLFYIACIAFIMFSGAKWAVNTATSQATETRDVWEANGWGIGVGLTLEPPRDGEYAYVELWLWPEEKGYTPILRFYGAALPVRGWARLIQEPQELEPLPEQTEPMREPQELEPLPSQWESFRV